MIKEKKVAKETAEKRAKRRRYEKHRNLLNNKGKGVVRRSKPVTLKTKVVEKKINNLLDKIKKLWQQIKLKFLGR